MAKKRKKNLAVQTMKALAREQVPVGSIRSKVVPCKKRKLLDKIAKREAHND